MTHSVRLYEYDTLVIIPFYPKNKVRIEAAAGKKTYSLTSILITKKKEINISKSFVSFLFPNILQICYKSVFAFI